MKTIHHMCHCWSWRSAVFSNVEAQLLKRPSGLGGLQQAGCPRMRMCNADEWNMQYRAFLQQLFAEKWEMVQIGLG